MSEHPNPSRLYAGPERRVAFFPRRLRSVALDALLVELPNGDRRSGRERRQSGQTREPTQR